MDDPLTSKAQRTKHRAVNCLDTDYALLYDVYAQTVSIPKLRVELGSITALPEAFPELAQEACTTSLRLPGPDLPMSRLYCIPSQ